MAVAVDGRTDPVTCAVPPGMNLLGFATGDTVKLDCVKNGDGVFVVRVLVSAYASITPDGAWFAVEGTIGTLDASAISLDVEGRGEPVACAVAPGAALGAFHVGDAVRMRCKLVGSDFTLKLLDSATAH